MVHFFLRELPGFDGYFGRTPESSPWSFALVAISLPFRSNSTPPLRTTPNNPKTDNVRPQSVRYLCSERHPSFCPPMCRSQKRQTAAFHDSAGGNWEYHPTAPPPPMGSPQVRLEPRGGAKPFLYASSDDNSGGYASSEETDETDEDTVGEEADDGIGDGRNGRRSHSGSSKGGAGSHAGGRDRRGSSGASSAASRKRSKSSTGPLRPGGGGGGGGDGSDDSDDTEGYNSTGGGGGRRGVGSGRLRSNSIPVPGGGGRRSRRRSSGSRSRDNSTARDKQRQSRRHEKRHSAAPMVYRKPTAATRSSGRLDGGPGSLLGLLGAADGEDAVPVVAVRKPAGNGGALGSGGGGPGDKGGRTVPMFFELGSRARSPSLAAAGTGAPGGASRATTADEKALEALRESADVHWAGTGTPPASRRDSCSLSPPSPSGGQGGAPVPALVPAFQPTSAPRLRRRASSPLLSSLDAPQGGVLPYDDGENGSVGGGDGGPTPSAAGTGATTGVPAAMPAVPFPSRLLPRMGSSTTVGDVLGGSLEVGVGDGARGRGGRESAILKALAKGSSLQEAVGDMKRRGGGGRSISVGGDLSSLASLAEARGGGWEAAQSAAAAAAAVASPSVAGGQEPLVAAGALPTAGDLAASASSTSAATTVVGGAKLGRTSSIGKSSSSSHLPQVPEATGGGTLAAGAPAALPLTRAAESTGSFSSLQLGGPRVSSAPSVGGGGSGSGKGAGGVAGGLVPRKDRLLDILGQKKFTPRKDYPPSSMLFQVCVCVCVRVLRLWRLARLC